MGMFKRQSKAEANISFSSQSSPIRKRHQHQQWTTEEAISGEVRFKASPDVHLTRSIVTLEGTITVKTNESFHVSMQPCWRTERITFLSVGKESRARRQPDSRDGLLVRPFSFDLSECARHSTLEVPLPPSLDSSSGDGQSQKAFHKRDSSCVYSISYTLTAAAYSGRGLVASTAEKVSVVPTGELNPPSYGSLDAPGQHFMATSNGSHAIFGPKHKAKSVRFDVVGEQPSPLTLRAPSDHLEPSTNVSLTVKLSSTETAALANLPQQANTRAQLIMNTLVSPNGSRMANDRRRRDHDSDSRSFLEKIYAQNCTLSIPSWEVFETDGEIDAFAVARLSFLFRLPETQRVAPSFSTPLLARSYSLDLKVELAGDAGRAVKLSMPVQVLYESGHEKAFYGDVRDADGRKDSARSSMQDLR